MQATAREAVTPARLQGAEYGAGTDLITDVDASQHRLVRRAARSVVDHHDTPTGQGAREGDPPAEGGQHVLSGRAEQVDAPVTGPVRRSRRVEPGDDLGSRVEGPVSRSGAVRDDARTEGKDQGDEAEQGVHRRTVPLTG